MNGITRSKVIKVSKENGISCYQKNFSLFDVYGADEVFVTGTFGGLTPVVKVDGRVISDGKPGTMTEKLTDLYQQEIRKAVLAAKNVK
jgi:branched-chain amino acid aminotransferase